LTLAVLLTGAAGVVAQKGAHVGVHGLLNTTFIINQNSYGFEEYDYKQTFGAGAGLALGYNISDHIGLQTEINFIKLGQNYQRSRQPIDTRKYELNYTAIPVLFKYTSGEGMVKFYGQIGPQIMFLNNAAINYYDTDGTLRPISTLPHRFMAAPLTLPTQFPAHRRRSDLKK
jgi:hypothetical protein